MKHRSGRGAVGRAIRGIERYATDEEYRERQKKYRRDWDKKNREKVRVRRKNYTKELNEFKNHRCKKCDKLLEYRTLGEYCRKHCNCGRPKKK